MLSYADCEFETVEVEPTPLQQQQYDDAVGFWRVAFECCQHAAAELAQIRMKPKRGLMSLFWGTHQRFFKQLCMSIKVPELVRRAKAALKEGHAVVIGLQSTGEARLADAVKAAEAEEDLEDFRGLRALLEHLIDRFPCKESLAVRADDDANDGGTEKKGGGVRPKKAGATSADSTLLGSARVPAYVQAQNAARATAGGGTGASAAGAISLDSSDDDEYVDELQDMLGIKNAKDTFRRMCEMEMPLDDLKELWSTMVGGAAGGARAPPSKKETVIAGLVTAFGAICAMDRAELRERLIQSGMPKARVPKARRDRIEALWRARAGDRLGGIGGSAAGSGVGGSAGAGGGSGQRKMKGGDDGGDDDEGASAGERTLWRRLQELKASMCDALARLDLPENPLDQLIADLVRPRWPPALACCSRALQVLALMCICHACARLARARGSRRRSGESAPRGGATDCAAAPRCRACSVAGRRAPCRRADWPQDAARVGGRQDGGACHAPRSVLPCRMRRCTWAATPFSAPAPALSAHARLPSRAASDPAPAHAIVRRALAPHVASRLAGARAELRPEERRQDSADAAGEQPREGGVPQRHEARRHHLGGGELGHLAARGRALREPAQARPHDDRTRLVG